MLIKSLETKPSAAAMVWCLCIFACLNIACEEDSGNGPDECENHCFNGIQDCEEEGVDCGGECVECSDPCAGHCSNGILDCGEEDVDCGGECAACTDPCAGHCTNGVQDCGEEDIDCGGECVACPDPCAGHCTNSVQDCEEEGVDCGGECDPCVIELPQLRGVNLAGADFGETHLPGNYGEHYIYPTADEVDYFMSKGMNIFRLPFRWERMQRSQFEDFHTDEMQRMDEFIDYATGAGAWVLIDPHNYARYYGEIIGDGVPVGAFEDFWSKLADHFKDNDHVIFGLMNEPHSMATELWRDDANAAIAAIRATGAANLILVPGNAWSGAHAWYGDWYGTPNAEVILTIDDPADNYAIEVHQYLDIDSSGSHTECVSTTIGSERLVEFTRWLEENGLKGFLGEFAGAANPTCMDALDDMLDYLDANTDLWMGWTYWAAGPWWGDYMFSIEPSDGTDKPQMEVLVEHL